VPVKLRTVDFFYLLVMIVVIVLVDVLFLRHQFTERLITNVGIVVVFAVFYFTVLKRR
jgi:lipopolysaccharide export LptBFGC system permease protein LptF